MLQRDLAQHSIIASDGRAKAPVARNVFCPQRENDEFVDGRQVFHEFPRVFTEANPLFDQHGQFIRRLGSQNLEACAARKGGLIGHLSRLRRPTRRGSAFAGLQRAELRLAEITEDAVEILNRRKIDLDLAFS